jgi:synaptobrevin family protein YKT6
VLGDYIIKYQDPKQADTIMKVQQELDETKIILVSTLDSSIGTRANSSISPQHQTIEGVLARGEKLDNLVDKSAALSASSKAFYKTAKQQNSCCTIS